MAKLNEEEQAKAKAYVFPYQLQVTCEAIFNSAGEIIAIHVKGCDIKTVSTTPPEVLAVAEKLALRLTQQTFQQALENAMPKNEGAAVLRVMEQTAAKQEVQTILRASSEFTPMPRDEVNARFSKLGDKAHDIFRAKFQELDKEGGAFHDKLIAGLGHGGLSTDMNSTVIYASNMEGVATLAELHGQVFDALDKQVFELTGEAKPFEETVSEE